MPLASHLHSRSSTGTDAPSRALQPESSKGVGLILYYALVFLVVGLIAGVLGLSGIAAIAGQISWILFVIGVVLLVVHLVRGGAPSGLRRNI